MWLITFWDSVSPFFFSFWEFPYNCPIRSCWFLPSSFPFNKGTISSIFKILVSISSLLFIYYLNFLKKYLCTIYMHNGLCRHSNFSRQFSAMHSLLNMHQSLFLCREAAIILWAIFKWPIRARFTTCLGLKSFSPKIEYISLYFKLCN